MSRFDLVTPVSAKTTNLIKLRTCFMILHSRPLNEILKRALFQTLSTYIKIILLQ